MGPQPLPGLFIYLLVRPFVLPPPFPIGKVFRFAQ
jgi:hypothetical protein